MSWTIAWCLLSAVPGIDPGTPLRQALEGRCLLVVSINPESRVKADRGPARAILTLGEPALVTVKVANDAGVTASVAVGGPGIGKGGWLDAEFVGSPRLHGARVEYLMVRLTARESGRREATFRFDVGQGTQDLGFRAEVPVLFDVRKRTEETKTQRTP
jgi:hypothetical protein